MIKLSMGCFQLVVATSPRKLENSHKSWIVLQQDNWRKCIPMIALW